MTQMVVTVKFLVSLRCQIHHRNVSKLINILINLAKENVSVIKTTQL